MEEEAEIKIFNKTLKLPKTKLFRVCIGVLLVILGCFGFLPILGFWMIPLGILVLSYDIKFIADIINKFKRDKAKKEEKPNPTKVFNKKE